MIEMKQTKIIEVESRLEEFACGDIIEIEAPEEIFTFERGIHKNPNKTKVGRVYEKNDKSMNVVFREEGGWVPSPFSISHYIYSQENILAIDWCTMIQSYDYIYNKLNKFLMEVRL